MSYIACPICGGGLPGVPCHCGSVPRVAPLPPAPTGWSCPRCSRVWAPHVDQCLACNPDRYPFGGLSAGAAILKDRT